MRTLLCGIGRLENNYIREWVEHYKKLGFTNICLYDNNKENEEHFEDVIGDYIVDGFVIIKNVRGLKGNNARESIQIESYNNCYNEYKDIYDWIAFFDIDEFLILENSVSIDDFLSNKIYDNYQIINFNWKYYDDNDIIDSGDNYSITRFSRYANIYSQNMYVKFILRGKLDIEIISPHNIKQNDNIKVCNALGEDSDAKDYSRNIIHKNAWLNHYRFKTLNEYISLKLKRRWPDNHEQEGEKLDINMFFMYNNITSEKEKFIKEYFK